MSKKTIDHKNRTFFIIGIGGSATTLLTKVLNLSTNAEVFSEQPPKLCIESRELYKGDLTNPNIILKKKENHIQEIVKKGKIYGDKNPNYLPFIPYIKELWNPKFIFLFRDPLQNLQSAYHYKKLTKKGGLFSMKEDEKDSLISSPKQDWWDYSRLRPNQSNEYYNKWKQMSFIEKYSWYWNEFYKIVNYNIENILNKDDYLILKVEDLNKKNLKKTFNFIEITPPSDDQIISLTEKNVNDSVLKTGNKKKNFSRKEKQEFNNIITSYTKSTYNELYSKYTED